MNDPWNVKAVRGSDQYISCMKLNGVPLLPPVLSKECRKEMQYYKLLAKEVEKRISILKPLVSSESIDETCDVSNSLALGQLYELPYEEVEAGFDVNIDKITAISKDSHENSIHEPVISSGFSTITSNVVVKATDIIKQSPNLIIDLSLSINETGKSILESVNKSPQQCKSPVPQIEPPEHDYEYDLPEKEIIFDEETIYRNKKRSKQYTKDVINLNFSVAHENISEQYDNVERSDGPSSMNCKSFTGSLNNLYTESSKEIICEPKLTRQSSYTVLQPSPQLLAHLQVQSQNTGVAMSSISMSESLSNIHSPNKKRKSWDLETAKVKWSSMAQELKQATIVTVGTNKPNDNNNNKNDASKKHHQRSRSMTVDHNRKTSTNNLPKSEPIYKSKNTVNLKNTPSNKTLANKYTPKHVSSKKDPSITPKNTPTTESFTPDVEDPGTRVKELYEKIQKQQVTQMANLMEKQKKEQMLLQKLFEEQNNTLYKQLKQICPMSLKEVKEGWSDNEERGPVSLSQLTNYNFSELESDKPANILNETKAYINQCDNVLKKSKDVARSIKKEPWRGKNISGCVTQTILTNADDREHCSRSPERRSSRKLNYDSASTNPDADPPLTDRTNDTLADFNNVTLPSDTEELSYPSRPITIQPKTNSSRSPTKVRPARPVGQSTDSAIRSLECSIHNSMNAMATAGTRKPIFTPRLATPEEIEAASTIVAYAKGYLVRRLMRTERVQATVQTIKDALLCALELHRDREGIRGADVDLHRRLIQQITAACYNLHDTFVASSPADRCAAIAADRLRRRTHRASAPTHARTSRHTDVMSVSHSGAFPLRVKRPTNASLMTQSNYEMYSGAKCGPARYMPSPRRRLARPWR